MMKTKIKSKLTKLPLNWVFLGSITLVLLLMSWCSPIYRFAYDAVDMNVSWAISKAIYHGQVYFKDIFEQRGIYFYLLQPFTAFMPYYWAKCCIWLMEVGNLYGVYFILYKAFALVLGKDNLRQAQLYSGILCTITPFLPLMSNMISPEEFCFMPIAYVGYLFIKFTKTHKLTWQNNLLLGILFGYVINVKYSVAGPIVGFYLGIGFYLLFKKQFKQFFKTVGVAFGGLLLGEIPALIYFGANNALYDYFKYYFFDNAHSFALQYAPEILFVFILNNTALIMFLVFPLYMFYNRTWKTDRDAFWMSVWLLIGSFFGLISIGRAGVAYALPVILIFYTFAGPYLWAVKYYKNKIMMTLLIAVTAITIYGIIGVAKNGASFVSTSFLRMPSIDYYQMNNRELPDYRLSRMIDEYGGGKTITFGAISGKEFNFNKEYPKSFYFDQTTMSFKRYPQSVYGQVNYLKHKDPVWVGYVSIQLATSKIATQHDLKSAAKRWHREYKLANRIHFADLTALGEYYKKYPNMVKSYATQGISHNNYQYTIQNRFHKYLVQNYAPVFCGLDSHEHHYYSPVHQVTCYWLFVRKDKLKEYPSLKKHVINLNHLKADQFEYDMY